MKKFLFSPILAILLPYSLCGMNIAFLRQASAHVSNKIWSYSGYSRNNLPKSLGTLSFPEVQKLAYNKEFAHKELKSALARHEDIKIAPISQHSPDIKAAWRKTLNQFSIQDWNSMLLEREEDAVLGAINPNLPNFVKTNFKKHEEVTRNSENYHAEAKQFYNAQPLDESLQQYYQQNLQTAGYHSKIATIYQWDNDDYAPASASSSHIYVTPHFFGLPLEERLWLLAHENEHIENLHLHKRFTVRSSFPEKRTNTYLYFQFQEKEADLKANAHGPAIATGLLHFSRRLETLSRLEETKKLGNANKHPSPSERINYTQDLISKLEQEQKGYSWNPFYKTLGLTEWFKRC